MLGRVRRILPVFAVACLALAALSGCSKAGRPSNPIAALQQTDPKAEALRRQQAAERAKTQEAAQEIDQIPPPAKSRYLAVHTEESWANPFLVVGRDSIRVRVILPDAMPNSYGTGTMLRPADARKQDLDVRLTDLPTALSAVPVGAWPYGRVVAVEEAPLTVKADRPQVRRNVEATIQMLNDLGIVVDEWTGPNGSLLR
jgi:hypothetical protein